jgi:hypothetical protein
MHTLSILSCFVNVARLIGQYFVCSLVSMLLIVWSVSFAVCSVFDLHSGQYFLHCGQYSVYYSVFEFQCGQYLVYIVVSILYAVWSGYSIQFF